jgi:hypothetical protein
MASPPKLHPALLGGLFIGVVSALPVVERANGCCCLWMAVGGMLAAWVMQQNHPHQVALADGGLVGLLAGLIGAPIMFVASSLVALLLPSQARDVAQVLSGAEGMTPEARDLVRSIPPVALMIIGGVMLVVVGTIVSTVGGVIGAAIFRRSAPPAPPPPPGPPDVAIPQFRTEPARIESVQTEPIPPAPPPIPRSDDPPV